MVKWEQDDGVRCGGLPRYLYGGFGRWLTAWSTIFDEHFTHGEWKKLKLIDGGDGGACGDNG